MREARKEGRKDGRRGEARLGEARRGEERRKGNAEIESTTRGVAPVFRSTNENRGRPIKTYSRTSLVKTLTLFSQVGTGRLRDKYHASLFFFFFLSFLIDINGGNCRSVIIKGGKKGWLSGIKLFRWCECRFPKRIKRKGGRGFNEPERAEAARKVRRNRVLCNGTER